MRWIALAMLTGCAFVRGGASGAPPNDDGAVDVPRVSDGHTDARTDAPTDARADARPDAPPDAFVCSAAKLVCGGTTAVFICNGDCWVSCTGRVDEPTAKAACANWGGRLAPLQTANDQDCVQNTVLAAHASWIGFEQASGATTLAGNWSWNGDGLTPGYINWSGGQPNDADGVEDGAEQCAYMSSPSGMWQDQPCNTQFNNFSCRYGS